jgi:hypothetical protein
MKTETDKQLELLGFKLIVFKSMEHIVEYINESTGTEVRYNLLAKTVRLKSHLLGRDEAFECKQVLLDLISAKMLELTKGR